MKSPDAPPLSPPLLHHTGKQASSLFSPHLKQPGDTYPEPLNLQLCSVWSLLLDISHLTGSGKGTPKIWGLLWCVAPSLCIRAPQRRGTNVFFHFLSQLSNLLRLHPYLQHPTMTLQEQHMPTWPFSSIIVIPSQHGFSITPHSSFRENWHIHLLV